MARYAHIKVDAASIRVPIARCDVIGIGVNPTLIAAGKVESDTVSLTETFSFAFFYCVRA